MLSRAVKRFVDDIFPLSCAVCGAASEDCRVCDRCRDALPWIASSCPGCARPGAGDLPCASCQQQPLPVVSVAAPLHYRFPVDSMIKALKFGHKTWLAPAFAELIAPALALSQCGRRSAATAADRAGAAPLRACANSPIDAIVPVPLHRWRHARRGFNQSAEIAIELGRRLSLPVCYPLKRTRATSAQSGLDAKERKRNVHNAFRARSGCRLRHVLLIDDVITTGETVRAAAIALRRAGIERVSVAAVARASR